MRIPNLNMFAYVLTYFEQQETEKPWTEAVLFYEGREVAMTEPDETFFDTWELSYGDHTFTAIVVPETSNTDI